MGCSIGTWLKICFHLGQCISWAKSIHFHMQSVNGRPHGRKWTKTIVPQTPEPLQWCIWIQIGETKSYQSMDVRNGSEALSLSNMVNTGVWRKPGLYPSTHFSWHLTDQQSNSVKVQLACFLALINCLHKPHTSSPVIWMNFQADTRRKQSFDFSLLSRGHLERVSW